MDKLHEQGFCVVSRNDDDDDGDAIPLIVLFFGIPSVFAFIINAIRLRQLTFPFNPLFVNTEKRISSILRK